MSVGRDPGAQNQLGNSGLLQLDSYLRWEAPATVSRVYIADNRIDGLPPPVPTTMSSSPYTFDAPDADVIVRAPLQQGSEELKDFHVHKVILSVASTLFCDMFSIPQPPQPVESDATLPTVKITESAGVFETFLRLIYPIEPPVIDSLQLVDHLLQLAGKYMATGVHTKLKRILMSPSFLEADPISVYAIACRANLDEEATLTIPHTFETDLVQDIPRDKLRMMTVESYHRLLVEHSLRRDRLVKVFYEVYKFQGGWHKLCFCAGWLEKEMRLQISNKPFIKRETLECLLSYSQAPSLSCSRDCPLTSKKSPGFLSDFMHKIYEM